MDDILQFEDIQTTVNALNKKFLDNYISGLIGITDKDYRHINPCAEITLPSNMKGFQPGELVIHDYSRCFISPTKTVPNGFEKWDNSLNKLNQKLEGGTTMFNKGDEIVVVKNEYEQFMGMEGIIEEVTKSSEGKITYGIVFDKLKVGHDLDGKCSFGQGWYIEEEEIDLMHKSKLCRMIEKNESMITSLKAGSDICQNGVEYEVRKNGALTFLTEGTRKVFVYKDGAIKPIILNCISEDDRIVTLHLMESFRILPMMTIIDNTLTAYTQEQSDKLEATMFLMATPEAIKLIEEITELATTPITAETKIYKSEDEIYAELGITKS